MKPDGTLTTADVRDFDCIWTHSGRIIYATMYGGRAIKIEEWSIQQKMMVCPPELAGDNVIQGTAATPRLLQRQDNNQIRLYWTEQDNNSGNWRMRFKDLPLYGN